jgi:hypothetical protein
MQLDYRPASSIDEWHQHMQVQVRCRVSPRSRLIALASPRVVFVARLCASFREYAQSQRDHSLVVESSRFALGNLQKEKDDAERQREEYKHRFGAVYPQPILAASMSSFTHTHSHLDAAVSGHGSHGHSPPIAFSHASPTGIGAGQIDATAGVRAAQQQLANMRSRSVGTAQ